MFFNNYNYSKIYLDKNKSFDRDKKKLFIKIILIFIFIIIIIINLQIYFINERRCLETKNVCLCTIGKNENKYIREFVEYYKNYQVDKIFLYDNNDLNGENFEDVISDYINNGYVELINYRELSNPQILSYNDCYKKNSKNYDWLIFYDIDEYIYLKDFSNIKLYLGDKRFYKCERIQLNWIFYTDNNLLYYDNRTLAERFIERQPSARGVKSGGSQGIKSIVRGYKKNVRINDVHILSKKFKLCDGFGNRAKIKGIITTKSDFEYHYINHYYCKSTEEFINKIMKTDAVFKNPPIIDKIKTYLGYNKITKEKIDLIENRTKINLTQYRSQIIKE